MEGGKDMGIRCVYVVIRVILVLLKIIWILFKGKESSKRKVKLGLRYFLKRMEGYKSFFRLLVILFLLK